MVCDLFIYVPLGQVYAPDSWALVICKLMQSSSGSSEKEQSSFKSKRRRITWFLDFFADCGWWIGCSADFLFWPLLVRTHDLLFLKLQDKDRKRYWDHRLMFLRQWNRLNNCVLLDVPLRSMQSRYCSILRLCVGVLLTHVRYLYRIVFFRKALPNVFENGQGHRQGKLATVTQLFYPEIIANF